jgi:hypothetical protein
MYLGGTLTRNGYSVEMDARSAYPTDMAPETEEFEEDPDDFEDDDEEYEDDEETLDDMDDDEE